jgi:hypothetical protein
MRRLAGRSRFASGVCHHCGFDAAAAYLPALRGTLVAVGLGVGACR